eukprot:TRINITY_DN9048_c0_g1_i1.p1 TRINITY_DN9048_c0_g1~~TRINITY_DN9048_c0_g1_i1.p1  ORF type:complete len:957 (+),score=167.99 TRINITY_DN9048_c0_g1_i1:1693-4563(+)
MVAVSTVVRVFLADPTSVVPSTTIYSVTGGNQIVSSAISSDASHIFVAHQTDIIKVFNINTKKQVSDWSHFNSTKIANVQATGSKLLVSTNIGVIIVDARDYNELRTTQVVPCGESREALLAESTSGSELYVARGSLGVAVYNLNTIPGVFTTQKELQDSEIVSTVVGLDQVYSIAVTADRENVVLADGVHGVKVFKFSLQRRELSLACIVSTTDVTRRVILGSSDAVIYSANGAEGLSVIDFTDREQAVSKDGLDLHHTTNMDLSSDESFMFTLDGAEGVKQVRLDTEPGLFLTCVDNNFPASIEVSQILQLYTADFTQVDRSDAMLISVAMFQFGKEVPLPMWLKISLKEWKVSGRAPESVSGVDFPLFFTVLHNEMIVRVAFRFRVVPSLYLSHSPTGKVQITSPGNLGSANVSLLRPDVGRFVKSTFEDMYNIYREDIGELQIFGPVGELNRVLNQLRIDIKEGAQTNSNDALNTRMFVNVRDDVNAAPSELKDPVRILFVNNAPVVTDMYRNTTLNMTARPREQFKLVVNTSSVSDPDGDLLTWSLFTSNDSVYELPEWLDWDPEKQSFSGKSDLPEQESFSLRISDGYKSVQLPVLIDVYNSDPNVSALESQVYCAETSSEYRIRSMMFVTDADNDTLTFSASISGKAETTLVNSWIELNTMTGELFGTPTTDDLGDTSIDFTVSDDYGGTVTIVIVIEVVRSPWDTFMYILAIVTPIVSWILTVYSFYTNYGFLWNCFCSHFFYWGSEIPPQLVSGVGYVPQYKRTKKPIPRDEIKEIRVVRNITKESGGGKVFQIIACFFPSAFNRHRKQEALPNGDNVLQWMDCGDDDGDECVIKITNSPPAGDNTTYSLLVYGRMDDILQEIQIDPKQLDFFELSQTLEVDLAETLNEPLVRARTYTDMNSRSESVSVLEPIDQVKSSSSTPTFQTSPSIGRRGLSSGRIASIWKI